MELLAGPRNRIRAALSQPFVGRTIRRARPSFSDDYPVLALLTILGASLRLMDIGTRNLWQDELTSLSAAARNPPEFLTALQAESNMLLYYWLLFGWLRVVGFGAAETWIRLPSVALGVLSIPLTYALARRLHSPRAGVWAAGLLGVHAYHVLMSQETRAYSLFAALTVLSYFVLDRALRAGHRRDWLLHGVVTGLAALSHFFAAFVIAAQMFLVCSRRSWGAVRGLLLSGLVIAVLVLQSVLYALPYADSARLAWLPAVTPESLQWFSTAYAGGHPGMLAIYVLLITVGLLSVQSGTGVRGYRNLLLLSWFCVPVGLTLIISLYKPIFAARYLIETLPALAIMAGIGLARLPGQVGVLTVGALALLTPVVIQDGFQVRPQEDWRAAVRYTSQRVAPGDGWVFISKYTQSAFEYYAGWHWGSNPSAPYSDVFEPFDWSQAVHSRDYRGVLSLEDFQRFAAAHSRIWLIQAHEREPKTGGDSAAPVREFLTADGYTGSQRTFRERIRIFLYEKV